MVVFSRGGAGGDAEGGFFFVDGVVLVELKAVLELDEVHLVQVRNYLQVFGVEVGLLLNFGRRSLGFRRLRNGV